MALQEYLGPRVLAVHPVRAEPAAFLASPASAVHLVSLEQVVPLVIAEIAEHLDIQGFQEPVVSQATAALAGLPVILEFQVSLAYQDLAARLAFLVIAGKADLVERLASPVQAGLPAIQEPAGQVGSLAYLALVVHLVGPALAGHPEHLGPVGHLARAVPVELRAIPAKAELLASQDSAGLPDILAIQGLQALAALQALVARLVLAASPVNPDRVELQASAVPQEKAAIQEQAERVELQVSLVHQEPAALVVYPVRQALAAIQEPAGHRASLEHQVNLEQAVHREHPVLPDLAGPLVSQVRLELLARAAPLDTQDRAVRPDSAGPPAIRETLESAACQDPLARLVLVAFLDLAGLAAYPDSQV